jgi:hypothetical protein
MQRTSHLPATHHPTGGNVLAEHTGYKPNSVERYGRGHDEIEHSVQALQSITRKLRKLGDAIQFFTTVNAALVFVAALKVSNPFFAFDLSAIMLLATLWISMQFDGLRRQGEVLFSDLTSKANATDDASLLRNLYARYSIILKL